MLVSVVLFTPCVYLQYHLHCSSIFADAAQIRQRSAAADSELVNIADCVTGASADLQCGNATYATAAWQQPSVLHTDSCC